MKMYRRLNSALTTEDEAKLVHDAIFYKTSYRKLGRNYGISHETARNIVDAWRNLIEIRREVTDKEQ
jgi:hypothetical protein